MCRCNGILKTTRHNRHNGLLPAPTCYRVQTCCRLVYVLDLLRGSRKLITNLLRGNWCNRLWPLRSKVTSWNLCLCVDAMRCQEPQNSMPTGLCSTTARHIISMHATAFCLTMRASAEVCRCFCEFCDKLGETVYWWNEDNYSVKHKIYNNYYYCVEVES